MYVPFYFEEHLGRANYNINDSNGMRVLPFQDTQGRLYYIIGPSDTLRGYFDEYIHKLKYFQVGSPFFSKLSPPFNINNSLIVLSVSTAY